MSGNIVRSGQALPRQAEPAMAPLGAQEIWSLQGSIYEGFTTEIWCGDREPGKRTIAIVRDYQDALAIMADRLKPAPEELLPPALVAALTEFVQWSACARDRMDHDGKLRWKDARAVIRAAIDQATASETAQSTSDGEGVRDAGEASGQPTEPNLPDTPATEQVIAELCEALEPIARTQAEGEGS